MAQFNTRIALRYDTWANWNSTTATDKGANLVLLKGELGICSIPASTNAGQSTSEPVILIKVGDGSSKFSALPWISAKAADVYTWAKQTEAQFVTNFLGMTDGSKTIQELLDGVFATDTALSNAVAALEQKIADLAVATLEGRVKTLEDEVDALQTAVNTTLPNAIDAVDAKFANYTNTTGMNSAIATALQTAKDYADDNDTDTTYTFASGTTKGAFSVTPKGGSAQSVAIYGLGTAAYEAKGAFDASGAATTALADAKTYADGLIAGLDVAAITGAQSKTITSISETNGKISAIYSDIKITKSQVSDFGSYDASGSAASALADAKEYADGLIAAEVTRADGAYDAKGAAATAESNAKAYADDIKTELLGEGTINETYDTLKEISDWIVNTGSDVTDLAQDIATNAAAIEDIVDGTTTVAKATNATQLGGTAASSYLKKSEAPGYGDILTKTSAASTYQPKGDYATAEQGAKADSAVQSVAIATGTANGKVKLTVDGTATEASVYGLKSAAYTESSAYATSAQGTKADNAVAAIATYGDIVTHDASEFATAAQGGKADTAIQSGSFAGTALTKSGTALSISQADARTALGLGSAAYTASTAYDAAGTAAGLIAGLDVTVSGMGAGKTLKTLTEADGKIAATFQDIAITSSQVSGLATVATSGKMDDLGQTDTIVFYCGTASEVL